MPIQENEGVMLLLGIGLLIFVLGNYRRLVRFPYVNILVTGFVILTAGWLLTVLESFFWGDVLNLLEHMCYAASGIVTAVWLWLFTRQNKGIR